MQCIPVAYVLTTGQLAVYCQTGVPRQQPHRRSGLATLPSLGAVL